MFVSLLMPCSVRRTRHGKLHQVMNDAGLMLEISGKGLIVRDVCGDEKLAVKSSRFTLV